MSLMKLILDTMKRKDIRLAALLPEPVDADEAEIDRLMSLDLSTRLIVAAAIRRGRALERDSREG